MLSTSWPQVSLEPSQCPKEQVCVGGVANAYLRVEPQRSNNPASYTQIVIQWNKVICLLLHFNSFFSFLILIASLFNIFGPAYTYLFLKVLGELF